MKRYGKLHFGDIGKAFSVSFFVITIGWGAVSHYSFGGIYVTWQILLCNLAVSAALSVLVYRLRYHRVLEYDEESFKLFKGNSKTEGRWKDFTHVSLFHRGFGVLAVRLYRCGPDGGDFVEIPAGDIGLDASDFRFEAIKLIRKD